MHRLPNVSLEMLEIVIRHLKAVSMKSHKNKMSVFNLGVVFGPTLLRAVEETLAAILDIKFNNVVIEILIENYDLIFKSPPGKASDYLQHPGVSPPELVPRTFGCSYRSNRTNINYTQPVVRVITRANYTDSVMSSSLQNIPNGLTVYQNTNTPSSQQSIYESKLHMNQSTPSLNQVIAGTRELSLGRDPPSSPYHSSLSNTHRASSTSNTSISPHQLSSHLNSRDKLTMNRGILINNMINVPAQDF